MITSRSSAFRSGVTRGVRFEVSVFGKDCRWEMIAYDRVEYTAVRAARNNALSKGIGQCESWEKAVARKHLWRTNTMRPEAVVISEV